ncbi:MAG TPA: hypothetical protein EYQ00_08485 [Dehalococcoidia bacterium]|jgi:hypothetical protein|nr:hypothetical protein [Dehalococcoidia bacterium]
MKVGDLVRTTGEGIGPKDWVGVIMEIIHRDCPNPDYRTPSQYRVFFPKQKSIEHCYRNEIKLVTNESR